MKRSITERSVTSVWKPGYRIGRYKIVGAFIVLCVLAGALGAWTGAAPSISFLLQQADTSKAAALAPATAPLFLGVNVNLQQAANFLKVWSVFQKQPQLQSSLNDLKEEINSSTGCDFDKDIAPWWGPDAAVFLTDSSGLNPTESSSSEASSPNLVIAIGARNQDQAAAALQKCVNSKVTSQETYKNVKVSVYRSGAAAIVPGYALFASTPEAIHASIDTFTNSQSPSLATSAAFKSLVSRLPADRVATFYSTVNTLMAASAQAESHVPPQVLEQMQTYQAVGGSLAFAPNGLRVDMAVALDQTKLPECTKQLIQVADPGQVLNAVPANASLVISGNNLKGTLECTIMQMDPASQKQFESTMSEFEAQTGLNLSTDILSWMTGEYALVVTPSQESNPVVPGLGALWMVQAQDQNLIKTKLEKLQVILSLAGSGFKDQTIQGNTLKVGTVGAGSDAVTLGYGFVGNWFVLGGPSDALNAAVSAPKNSLADQEAFKQVRAALPAKNGGYYYVSVPALQDLFLSTMSSSERAAFQKEALPWLQPIKALGMATETGQTDVSTITLFVYIQGD